MNTDNKQTKFLDIKDELKKSVLRSYDIPDFGQVDLNLVNMANFFPLLQDLIGSFRPRIICEIGSDQGMTSDLLHQYCRTNNAQLHVVDPALHENQQSDNIVTYYRKMSIPYLEQAEPADIYFIDGDHNYYTVSNELRLIRDKNADDTPRLLFLHDVGWPCGYMDMYYDTTSIEQKYRKETTSGLNLSVFCSPYTTGKQGLPTDAVSVAIEDGGEANGVLAAVEKFLEESSGWLYCSIPSIFGLGVLWYGNGATQEMTQKVEQLAQDFGRWEPFLATLEFNRIVLLEKLQETGELWKEQNAFIEVQNRQLEDLVKKSVAQGREWAEQQEYITVQNRQLEDLVEKSVAQGREWTEQQEYIAVQNRQIEDLSEKIEAQGREWEAQRNYISELVSRNVSLDLQIMELENPFGWFRYMLKKALRWLKKRNEDS